MKDEFKKRNYNAYLILHWKNKDMKLVKRKPKNIGPYDIPVKISIDLLLPIEKEIQAKGEIILSQPKLNEILVEEI